MCACVRGLGWGWDALLIYDILRIPQVRPGSPPPTHTSLSALLGKLLALYLSKLYMADAPFTRSLYEWHISMIIVQLFFYLFTILTIFT